MKKWVCLIKAQTVIFILYILFVIAKDTQKTINILKSSSQPMVKKRQVMRAAFGDYRAKMADEEKKMRISEYMF